MAGMIAKYLAMSLAIENVVRAPRVISSCLPISTISMSLVGSESRSTMLPASLAADVPVFMRRDVGLRQAGGASLVPSPVIATSLPPSCSRLISASLSSGGGFGQEVVDTGLVGNCLGGQRVVTGDHHRADAHLAHLVEPFPHALLDDVLEVDDAENGGRAVSDLADRQRCATGGRDLVHDGAECIWHRPAVTANPFGYGIGCALA